MATKSLFGSLCGMVMLLTSVSSHAISPSVIHYRGHLDVPGVVPAGTVQRDLTFNLYETDIGGAPLWTETQTLDIYDGNFAAVLGTYAPLTPALFTGEFRYLGVTVGGGSELTPRQRIAAVPYSMQTHYAVQAANATHAGEADHAADADTLGGGQVYADTQGVHIAPISISETVYVNGWVDATGGLSCDESLDVGESVQVADSIDVGQSMVVGNLGAVGRTSVDTACVFHINENDNSTSPSTLDRLRVTTVRRFGLTPITLWHLVVSEDGYVGVGTNDPKGPLDVNGAIYQRGSVLHSDYVFDDGYALESIEEHSEMMWDEKHLPEVPPREVDEEGREVLEVGAHRRGMLVELEKAHIYIEQLNEKIKELEAKIERLEEKNEEE